MIAGIFTPSRPGYSHRCLEGLPEGTTFVGFQRSHDWHGNWSADADAVLVFRHESFPLIAVGQPLTLITPVFQTVYRPEEPE
jgi:hypothetical protein